MIVSFINQADLLNLQKRFFKDENTTINIVKKDYQLN